VLNQRREDSVGHRCEPYQPRGQPLQLALGHRLEVVPANAVVGTRALQPTKQDLGGTGIGGSALAQARLDLRIRRRFALTACGARGLDVGETVTFVDNDPTDNHTVTFGPEEYTSAIEGSVFEYAGGSLVFNPLSALSSEPPDPASPARYDGTNHGNGYLNSGLLYPPQIPDQPHQFAVTFTKPGIIAMINRMHLVS
jgi:hypothetical protein